MRADGHRRVRQALAIGLVAALGAATAGAAATDPSALCALPGLALALLMWLRRYPGERLLAVLSAARRPRPWRRPARHRPTGARLDIPRPRGGLLLARALAVRPPPLHSPAG